METLRFQVFDAYQRLSPRPPAAAPVVVVDVDDTSLRRIGQWPWLRKLDEAGAAVVGLDLILAEPDGASPEHAIPLWGKTTERIRDALGHLPEHDAVLAEAVRSAPVVTGFALTRGPDAGRPPRPCTITITGADPRPVLPAFTGAVANLPRIDAGARGAGGFNFLPSVDGVLRRAPLLLRFRDDVYPSFSLEMLRVLLGAEGYEVRVEEAGVEGAPPAVEEVAVGGLVIPADEAGRVWLHYPRPEARRSVPAWRVLAGEVPGETISGHAVVVGASAAGLKDLRATPLDLAAPGVAIHVVALEQMLLGHFLERPAWIEPVELVYMLALGVALILLLRKLKALGCASLGAVAVAVAAGLSWYSYTEHRLLIDPVLPSLVALLVYMAGSLIPRHPARGRDDRGGHRDEREMRARLRAGQGLRAAPAGRPGAPVRAPAALSLPLPLPLPRPDRDLPPPPPATGSGRRRGTGPSTTT